MSSTSTTHDAAKSYYSKGSQDLAVETPVMHKRLETRRAMTRNGASAERLLVVLVGLPARGKSFIARKLLNYLVWRGNQCKIFNVGMYRRRQVANVQDGTTQNADFFDDSNQKAARLRQEAASMALQETLQWLGEALDEDPTQGSIPDCSEGSSDDDADFYFQNRLSYSARRQYHRIAIFDATNSTKERRQWILKQCAEADATRNSQTGVLFLESICDDQELLQENFKVKIATCPDFTGMDREAALEDLRKRIEKYETRYETIEECNHESYIKIFNLSSRLVVNHVYGRLAKVVLPAIMAWNTGSRPIFLVRSGETEAMENYVREAHRIKLSNGNLAAMTDNPSRRKRSDRLGKRGLRFRDAVAKFIEQEGRDYMKRKYDTVIGKMDTGTSISGLNEEEGRVPLETQDSLGLSQHDDWRLPFPCLVLSSTMPRAIETATWKHPFPVKDITNLNPLDMGDFSGMDLASIREQHPKWYGRLRSDPFHTRYGVLISHQMLSI